MNPTSSSSPGPAAAQPASQASALGTSLLARSRWRAWELIALSLIHI